MNSYLSPSTFTPFSSRLFRFFKHIHLFNMASLGFAYLMDSESKSNAEREPKIILETQPDPDLPTQPLPLPPQPIGSPEVTVQSAQPTITMPLPPLTDTYNSPEEGIAAINTFARNHGYAVSTLRSKTTKKGIKKTVRLCCDRGRANRRSATAPKRQRETAILANECPFSMSLRLQDTIWILTVESLTHNHTPSSASTHPAQRRLELSQRGTNIERQFNQGLSARHIITGTRQKDPDTCLIPRDIHNFKRKLLTEFLNSRTSLQALLVELPKDSTWIFKFEVDEEDYITALFCMHKTGVTMLQADP
jgi:hypothetical protein